MELSELGRPEHARGPGDDEPAPSGNRHRTIATETWDSPDSDDEGRFVKACSAFGLGILVDIFGQIAVRDSDRDLGLHVLRVSRQPRRLASGWHAGRAVGDHRRAVHPRWRERIAAALRAAQISDTPRGTTPMNVAFHLRRRPICGSAVALLLPSRDVAGVLGLCARLGLDPSGRVHDVAGGFLLRLDDPTTRAFPGVVRLRSLAENLFIPVDADLVPALLDDEAEGLTRRRGTDRPSRWADPRLRSRRPACPVGPPDRHRPAAARLATAAAASAAGRPDRGDRRRVARRVARVGPRGRRGDDRDRAAAARRRRFRGTPSWGAPRSAPAWGWPGWGVRSAWADWPGSGASWVGRALNRVPRLSEALLDRQAAALRALLNEFRAGDLERALRRALPMGEPGGARGSVADPGDRLPTRRTTYALNDLLSTGPAAMWFGNEDVMAELSREYRKAALHAVQTGDYRRAAFIYGTLLKDYSAAAQALLRGGLHHDAAILFLAKLDDRRSAARAFEAAGEFDRAVTLFRALGDHVAAGDLLRRIGQEDEALEEYRLAADLLALVEREGGRLAAGDLLLSKVGDGILARTHFAIGWGQRPAPNAVSCALRLLQLDATAGNLAAMRELLDEASAFFAWNRDLAQVERFYNELATLAGQGVGDVAAAARRAPRPGAARPGDRAARTAHPGASAGRSRRDPGAPARRLDRRRDQRRRLRHRRRDQGPAALPPWPSHRPRRATTILGCNGSAPAGASSRPSAPPRRRARSSSASRRVKSSSSARSTSEVACVADDILAVTALAVSSDGSALVTLRSNQEGRGVLSSYERMPGASYRALFGTALALKGPAHPGLTSIVSGRQGNRVGVWYGQELNIREVSSLAIWASITPRPARFSPPVLLLPWPPNDRRATGDSPPSRTTAGHGPCSTSRAT